MVNWPSLSWCAASLLVAIAWVPARAHACETLENCFTDFKPGTATVPVGGALVLVPEVYNFGLEYFDPAQTLTALTVTVTPAGGGEPVLGTLAMHEEVGLFAWRPLDPLPVDTVFEVSVAVDHTLLGCYEDNFSRAWMVTTTTEALPELVVPALTATPTLHVEPWFDLETVVCCDGAYPELADGGCSGDGLVWFEGECAAGEIDGRLEVALALDAAAVASGRGQVGYAVDDWPLGLDGVAPTFSSREPECVSAAAIHLATGVREAGPEVCLGQEFSDMLQRQAVDPAPGLAACVGAPYTCESISGYVWDEAACTPWTGGEETGTSDSSSSDGSSGDEGGEALEERGCGCRHAPDEQAWWIGLLALAWRRRATRR